MKKTATKRQTSKSIPEKQPQAETLETRNAIIDNNEITEVDIEFREAQKLGQNNNLTRRKLMSDTNSDVEPVLASGDPDADWVEAGTSGDESVVGGNTTPDQNDVDQIGEAVGLEYQDNEPLHTTEKITERDKHRWELDPASSEDYKARVKGKGM